MGGGGAWVELVGSGQTNWRLLARTGRGQLMVLAWWQEWLISNGFELVALRFRIFCWANGGRLWVVLSGVFSLWVMLGVVLVACLALAGLATVLSAGYCCFINFSPAN